MLFSLYSGLDVNNVIWFIPIHNKMPIVLKNARYFDWKTNQDKVTHILVEEGPRGRLLFSNDINVLIQDVEKAQMLDCSGKIVTHSWVNAHHHSYLSLSRTAANKDGKDFVGRLKSGAWAVDKALDRESIEAAAMVSAMESLKCGTTFIIEHHSSQGYISDSLETVMAAFQKVGISSLPCFEVSDRNGYTKSDEALDYTEQFLRNNQGLVGLHASFTVGSSSLQEAVRIATRTNSGIHMHLAESTFDQEQCLKEYNKSVTERMADAGVLQFPKTILAHAIHLSNQEATLIEESPVWIVENVESNQCSNVGNFNSEGLGDRIMLGTDGLHYDMLRSMKAAFFSGQGYDEICPNETLRRLRMGNEYLSANKFIGDGDNNLVIYDYPSTTEINASNFANHILRGIEARHIQHVISSGQLVVENRTLTSINEADLMMQVREITRQLLKRI